MVYLQQNVYIFFILCMSLSGSDQKKTSEEPEFHKSQLTPLVGYPATRTVPTITVTKSVYDTYQTIFKLPYDIQCLIAKQSVLYEMYQRAYLKSFKRTPKFVIRGNMPLMTNLSALNEDVVALAQSETFIEIWSLKDRKKIFTSNQLSSAANCYRYPLLMSGSPDTALHTWNTSNNYKHAAIRTEHLVHINLLSTIGNGCVISSDLNGVFSIHNAETLDTKNTVTAAHDGLIYTIKPVSSNTFITGGDDSYVKEWDTRITQPISARACSSNFVPYGIHAVDELYIIVGGSQEKIYILDRRMNLMLKEELNKSMAYDMTALNDNTIVYGHKTIYFDTWDGNELAEKHKISLSGNLLTVITNNNDTVIYADKDGRIFCTKPTGKPYHLTQDPSFEQCIMAGALAYDDAS